MTSRRHGAFRRPMGWIVGCTAAVTLAVCFALRADDSPTVETPATPAGVTPPAAAASQGDATNLEQQAAIARLLADRLPRLHLSRRPLDDRFSEAALDLYLNALDFDHSFFLQADIDEFSALKDKLDDMLKEGDVAFAFKVYRRFMDRLRERIAYVDTLLKEGFDVTVDEMYDWKRKDAPWPADEAAQNELWRKKVKNEYVARRAAVQLARESGETARKDPPRTDRDQPAQLEGDMVHQADAVKDLELSPEEFVAKRYRRLLTILEDNDQEYILDRFFNAFTQTGDPHSSYLSPSRAEDFDISMSLSLVGIGAQLSSEDGAVKVERIIPGGPAERDGRLKPGDKIVAVAQDDGPSVDILHWPLYKVVQLIRGKKGTKVVLTVWPASDVSGATEKKIDFLREEVKLEESAARSRLDTLPAPDGSTNTLGVITLPEFYADFKGQKNGENARSSAQDMRRLVAELAAQNVDGLVLDLRNNGGGSLPDAIQIAGLFIEGGPVVQVKDRLWVRPLNDPDPAILYRGPMVVLVNRMSASASEIVAAALQDYGRAIVLGDTKTHGKGTVQSLLPLDPGAEQYGTLKVTTASFYRIAGGSTQLKGVASDIVLPSYFDTMEVGEEYLPHAMDWTIVPPANFAPYASNWPLMITLREQSEQRGAHDPQFVARRALLERLAARFKAHEVSLNLEARIRQLREEKDLDKAQQELDLAQQELEDGAAKENDEARDRKDLVLQEALHVLRDVIAFQKKQEAAATAGN